jgi:hypothetical protein
VNAVTPISMSGGSAVGSQDKAKEKLRRLEQLAADRAPREQQWQEIAELINPMRADFNRLNQPGQKRSQKIYDGTAGLAAENLVSGLWATVTNSANIWFEMRSAIDELNRVQRVKLWLDAVTARMRQAYAGGGGNFYVRAVDFYADMVTIGTGIFFAEEIGHTGQMYFSCRHPAECYLAQNDREQVDTVYRKFRWSARQAVKRWGNAVSDKVKTAAEKEPDRQFEFLHAVEPAEDYDGRILSGRPIASCAVDIEGKVIVEETGYHEFPYQPARWATRSRDVYGDSQGMLVLPDVKMLNTMAKTSIVAAQKKADPALLAQDEMSIRGIRTAPGKIIYGGVDQQGRQIIHPLQTNGDVGLTLEMMDQRRQAIKEGFFWSLLMLIQSPDRETATAFLGRQEEQLRMMGPHLGRTTSEFLDPLSDRVFASLYRAGAFPPPPPELLQYPQLKIEYVSPLARAQKVSEANSVVRAMESLGPLGVADPSVYDNVDKDQAPLAILDGFSVPARIYNDPDKVAAIRDQRAKQQMAQLLAANAKPVADAAKSGADAAQIVQQMSGAAAAPAKVAA